MNSQISRRARVYRRIVIWSYVALWLLHLIAAWTLQGKPELLWRWLYISKYLAAVCVGLQLAAIVFVMRRRGIVPTILVLIGGVSLLGFIVFLQIWLLLLGVAISIAAGFCVAWPQIRDLLNRMGRSYREIAKPAKM